VPFRGRIIDLVLLSTVFLLANFGIGLLIANLVHTQMATLIIVGLIFILPSINEAGIFYPLYAMSPQARLEAMVWPATHYVFIVRGIFLKGVGLPVLLTNGLYLLGVGPVDERSGHLAPEEEVGLMAGTIGAKNV